MPAVPHASSILASLGQAAFVWDLATDAIAWGEAAANLLQGLPPEALERAAALARFMEPTQTIRADAIIDVVAPT